MAIIIGDNFNYQGKQSNFIRDSFKTLAEMKAYPETSLDNGHRSFCEQTKKYYEYLDSNSVDTTLGKWRLITDTALNESSENPVQNKIIAQKFAQITADAAASLVLVNKQMDALKKELLASISESEEINSTAFGYLYQRLEDLEKITGQALADLDAAMVTNDTTINGHLLEGNVTLTKSDVGLSNVNNTSDANKPISTATQTALNGKVDKVSGYSLASNVQLTKLNNLPDADAMNAQLNSIRGDISDHADSQDNPHNVTAEQTGAVPITRTVNGHALNKDIEITAGDLGLNLVNNTPDVDKPLSKEAIKSNEVAAKAIGELSERVKECEDVTSQSISDLAANMAATTINGQPLEGEVVLMKGDVGLENVDNTSDQDKPISTATQNALNGKVDKVSGKALSTNDYTTTEKNKLAGIETGAQVNKVTSVAGKTGAVSLIKSDVGLGNVDNTADIDKPLSKEAEEVNYISIKTFGELIERVREYEETTGAALCEIAKELTYILGWIKEREVDDGL